jgi:hypothetical protein
MSGNSNKFMERNKSKLLSENAVNDIVSQRLEIDGFKVLTRIRINPAELDIVMLDPRTLELTNIEIKKNRWERLFQQALRGKLYCHYSVVMIPICSKGKIDLNSFTSEGIGVIFYEELSSTEVKLHYVSAPKRSNQLNRNLKKLLYQEISTKHANSIYA